MADPLSPATRATKRNLLLASVVAISANAFNVSVDRIPVAGLSISFDDRLFAFLLLVVLVYFFCTFVLYYVIDIKNLETTEHQKAVKDAQSERIGTFAEHYLKRIREDLQNLLPEGYVHVNPGQKTLLEQNPSRVTYVVIQGEKDTRIIERSTLGSTATKLDDRLRTWIESYPKEKKENIRRSGYPVIRMRVLYSLRNYFFDGALPIALALGALAAILFHLDLTWIQGYLPSFKTLSPHHT